MALDIDQYRKSLRQFAKQYSLPRQEVIYLRRILEQGRYLFELGEEADIELYSRFNVDLVGQ